MSRKFDELLRNQKITDAGRYLADELYKNGKIRHTRKLLIEWLSDKVDEQEKEIDELNHAKHLACKKSEYYRKIKERYHDVLHIIKTKTLDEKTKDLVEKTLYAGYEGDYVPCEYCKSIEESTLKSPRRKYKYCPICGRARR